jgi:hypothetical protein
MGIVDWIVLVLIIGGLFYLKIYQPAIFAVIDNAATSVAQSVFGMIIKKAP